MRRALTWTAVVLTALLLQSTVFAQVELLGAKPELMYLITVVLAILDGPRAAAKAGFAAGLAQDLLLNNFPKGSTALTLTLVGYVIGSARQYIVTPSPLLPVLLVSAATFSGLVFYGFLVFLVGKLTVGFGFLLRTALLSALYNAALTPLFYPLLRRVTEASRAKKVFR